MEYSKTKLKSSGDKASPCFKPFYDIDRKIIRQIFTYAIKQEMYSKVLLPIVQSN
jgi:hypothetical protein